MAKPQEKLNQQVDSLAKDSGLDLRRIIKLSAMALGVLAVILLAFLVLWPLRPTKPKPRPDIRTISQALTYEISNSTPSDWKDVKMEVKGAEEVDGSDTATLESSQVNDEGSLAYFKIGDVLSGTSRRVTIYVTSASEGDEFEVTASFRSSDGVLVRAPETKKVRFR